VRDDLGVLGSHKSEEGSHGIRAMEEEDAPTIKNEFSLEINKRGA
jgi:hypothetical protein